MTAYKSLLLLIAFFLPPSPFSAQLSNFSGFQCLIVDRNLKRNVGQQMSKIKRHFQLEEFTNKFETEGPGVEQDMDRGQKSMESYSVEFEKLEANRLEMGKRTYIHNIVARNHLAF